MIYTPIQNKMPSRCHECRDDACKHWKRDNPLEERHPECPLIEFPGREEASVAIEMFVARYRGTGEWNMWELLNKLGFKEGV